jgi:rSAM/selenodomain-associated transferase 2
MLSIVIPTLNAAKTLEATLAAIATAEGRLGYEVIVVDGGSIDDTRAVAERGGAIFIETQRGRGQQLAAGALTASGDWFLFVHADTRLPEDWSQTVGEFMASAGNASRAAFFRFALDDPCRWARLMAWAVSWRSRHFGMPYGDQGLLISRPFYEQLGGYKRIPLMEDVDLASRIGRRRLRCLDAVAITSAERYRREGYLWRPLRNTVCLALYTIGVPARYIVPLYR